MDDYKIIIEQEHQTVMAHYKVEQKPAEGYPTDIGDVYSDDFPRCECLFCCVCFLCHKRCFLGIFVFYLKYFLYLCRKFLW